MTDLLTIAIPVYNRDRFFREALESALKQTVPVEVMVVDNCSPDVDFRTIVESYNSSRVKFHRNKSNLGMAGNWNECMRLATSPFVSLLHDDDRIAPDYVETFLSIYEPTPILYWSACALMDESGKVLAAEPIEHLERFGDIREWAVRNAVQASCIFSRDVAVRLGGFNTKMRMTMDYDLWFRMALEGRTKRMPGKTVFYRDYETDDRATALSGRRLLSIGCARIQVRRNIARLEKKNIFLNRHGIPFPALGFKALMKRAASLSDYRLRYAVGLCIQSRPRTFLGLMSRLPLVLFGSRFVRLCSRLGI